MNNRMLFITIGAVMLTLFLYVRLSTPSETLSTIHTTDTSQGFPSTYDPPVKVVNDPPPPAENKFRKGRTDTNASATYSLIKTDARNPNRFVVNVRISRKLTEEEMRDIANRVKQSIQPVSKIGRVFFWLPGWEVGTGAWGWVHYDPSPSITIHGQSLNDEATILSAVEVMNGYEAIWMNEHVDGLVVYAFRKDRKRGLIHEILDPTDPKPAEIADQLQKSKRNGKTIYTIIDEPSTDYFVLEHNGDLSVYDNVGYIETYTRIK